MVAYRFQKGQPRPLGAGRRAGTPNKVAADIKAICQRAAPALIAELLRIATHSRSEAMRLAATKEILDRGFGRPKMSVESELVVGVSLQLQELLARCDGQSRSLPSRTLPPRSIEAIEHDANGGGDHGNDGGDNGGDGLH